MIHLLLLMEGVAGGSGIVILKFAVPLETVQTFKGTTKWKAPAGVTQVDYLVVAGGGGAGGSSGISGGGGGGAGGYRTGTGFAVTAGTTYTVTVGGGGAGSPAVPSQTNGVSGSNSVFSTITSAGGGGGGATSDGTGSAQAGGSGGGGWI
jgi:hypothetical protein